MQKKKKYNNPSLFIVLLEVFYLMTLVSKVSKIFKYCKKQSFKLFYSDVFMSKL